MKKAFELAAECVPSKRQISWQQTEFYALINYGLPVFTGKQYGDGFTPPTMFWPEDIDVDSWCQTAKNAGMNGVVLTCKHYDGFCLWPTEYTDYSIKNSNWCDGSADLAKLVSEACRKYQLKFGIYLAPWDRHEKTYGTGKAYDDFFCGLLTELLTNYGDVFCVWLDGIVGSDEKNVQDYDWGRYYSLIRSLAPDAVISFMGPDVRWSGNEKGFARKNEWSSVPAYLGIMEDGTDYACPRRELSLSSPDIGGRRIIKNSSEFIWYPCEVSVPMRAHWFFDEEDKYSVKTKDKLLTLYFNTVGNNSCLMLGLSPNKRGVLDETDTQILVALGCDLKINFGFNLLTKAIVSASSSFVDEFSKDDVISADYSSYWKPDEHDKKPELLLEFEEEQFFDKLVLSENITHGQHVEAFEVLVPNEKGKWKTIYEGECIGYKKICCLEPVKAEKLKIVFTSYRKTPEISFIQLN